ncbi:MAG: hypothetical protein WBW81_07685 [Methylocella sp.]
MLITGALELIAISIALRFTTINDALFLFFGIRALRSTGICIRPAIRLAVIGEPQLVVSGAGETGRRGWSAACHHERTENAGGQQKSFHGRLLPQGSRMNTAHDRI